MNPQHHASADDRAFRTEFEACRIPPAEFSHRAHIRLAYVYLVDHDVETAYDSMRRALLAFLEHNGIDPSKYHDTITRAWIMAVRHFMEILPDAASADAFMAGDPRMLDARIMMTHYSAEVLFSAEARAGFVEPNLDPIPRYDPIRHLPPVAIEGHQSSGLGGPDHPMRLATRRAAGLDAAGWTPELRAEVGRYFDDLAGEWHTRTSPQRAAVVLDALSRGLAPMEAPARLAVEIGSGTGAYSPLLAARFATVLAVDLSRSMLKLAPDRPAYRVQADAASLPVRGGAASVVVLINAFAFPSEIARVLAPRGALVWVNSSGEQTPIYLSAEDLLAQLPGQWTGTASRAGEGHWCVLTRTPAE